MIEAVVLGSGTSNGVPSLGYQYTDAFLANPKNHRTRSSLLLCGPTGNVLIDCSQEMRLQLLRERVDAIEAVIITHTHADHVMGMDDLRAFCLRSRRPMPVYTLPRYQEDIKRIFPYAWEQVPTGDVPRFDLRDTAPTLELGGMQVATFVVEHGPVPCLGVRVGDLAYLTDVSRIPDDIYPLLAGLDTLIIDAVRYKPHPNHFHFESAMREAESIGAGMTYFTHLSHDYDHDKVESELPPGIRLAFDGLRIPIRL